MQMSTPLAPQSPMPRISSASVATSRSMSSAPGAEGPQARLDAVDVIDAQEDAAGTGEGVAEGLDGLTHDGVVDDREHLEQVALQQRVEERGVVVVQAHHVEVPVQVGRLRQVGGVAAIELRGHVGDDGIREQARQPERLPLFGGEGDPLVEGRIAEHLVAARRSLEDSVAIPFGDASDAGGLVGSVQAWCLRDRGRGQPAPIGTSARDSNGGSNLSRCAVAPRAGVAARRSSGGPVRPAARRGRRRGGRRGAAARPGTRATGGNRPASRGRR